MGRKFPPRGYSQTQFPLPHDFNYKFALDAADTTKEATICTLFRASEGAINADTVLVNPAHATFAEDTGPMVYMGSIIPRVSVSFTAKINQVAHDIDKVQHLNFKWMPIYTAFLNTLDAENVGTPASDIETIIEMKHDTTNKRAGPLFTGTDLLNAACHPLSTIGETEVFGDYDLTTNAIMEAVNFQEEEFWDAKSYYTNAGMLNKVTGSFRTVSLDFDRKPYTYGSSNFTKPMVKRGNPYMFCGILFYVPPAGEFGQTAEAADITTSISHIQFYVKVRFDEWNSEFDQTAA